VILVAAALLAGILIALDAQRNLRTGSATTLFRTYSKRDQAAAFWTIFGVKVFLSAALAILSSALIVRESA
jgi:hypothetical protein